MNEVKNGINTLTGTPNKKETDSEEVKEKVKPSAQTRKE
jgi:hypothetical protein